ncbi:hypothetical protein IRY55_12845 [Savagea sp. SN6]|uniref:Uncharacterized protein n=1 Tax=Savagea serpentis TaxID=2785297 RepID=A0A8J7KM84_9BACL|nr:hypothetical protein [Savagea serpentis]MBF4502249.1 hypothetical protein [Savagea serpentis]
MNTDNNIFQLPAEIDLLFDNKKLDVLIYLVTMYHLAVNFRKRRFSLEQLLYYYSIIYFESHEINSPLIYKYLRDKKRVNEIMIYLENLHFIQIHGDIFTPINKLKISVTQRGIGAIDALESDSVEMYLNKIFIIIRDYPYETMSTRFNHLLYEGEF